MGATVLTESRTAATRRIVDAHGRVVRDLRISVTPRCNFHCLYCDPLGGHHDPAGTISIEQVDLFLRAAAELGCDNVRLTGGEPLVRRDLEAIVERVGAIPGIRDISITTNGVMLAKRLPGLLAAGLHRVNISMDSADPGTFRRITGGGELAPVMQAVEASLEAGIDPVKINAVVIRGMNEGEVAGLARLSLERPLHVRFIEYMHLNNAAPEEYRRQFVSGAESMERVARELGELAPVPTDPSSPARVYRADGAAGTIGFINPVSVPFCGGCSRMRLTADLRIRPCLLTDRELDARAAFQADDPVAAIQEVLLEAARVKPAMGNTLPKLRERTMVAIGG